MKSKSTLVIILISSILILCACQAAPQEGGRRKAGKKEDQEILVEESSPSTQPDLGKIDDIEVINTNFYQDQFGTWRVFGLMTNLADYPIIGVELELDFLSPDGSSLYKETISTGLGGIPPGGSIPFRHKISQDLSSTDQISAGVVNVYKTDQELIVVELAESHIFQAENDVLQIAGRIENPSSQPISLYQIAAALFSPEGKILFSNECDVCPRYLGPGESGPFRIIMFGFPPDFKASGDYQVYATAGAGETAPTFDIGFSEIQHTYLDQFETFHILGEIQNNSPEILEIHLLNTLYDGSGSVIDASEFTVMPGSLAPGEKAPYDVTFGGPSTSLGIQPGTVSWKIEVDYSRTRKVDGPSHILTTSGDSQEISENQISFSGQVENNAGEEVQIVLILVEARERSSDKLVGLSRQLYWGSVLDGGSRDYQLLLKLDPDLDPQEMDFKLIVRGR
jgi:hypothetical protein